MMEFFQTKSYGRGIADFDEFIQKKSHITLRSCLIALCFDPTTLIEIAVYKLVISHNYRRQGSRSEVDLLPEATWLTHMVKLVISINHG